MHSKNLANVSHAIPAPNVPNKYEGAVMEAGAGACGTEATSLVRPHNRSAPNLGTSVGCSENLMGLDRDIYLPPIYWGLSTNRLNPFRMIVYDFDPHRGILLKILPSDQTPTVHVHVLISLFCLSTKTPRFGGVCVLVFSITCLWVFECINSVCLLGLLRLCNYVFCMRVSASARC